jgi:hypothetical protein
LPGRERQEKKAPDLVQIEYGVHGRFFRRINPDSAVERECMSKEQTFRSKDNAFCL